ncbi:MAG: acyl--CoA ligase [Alphaproteobacteria bacterium]|nr:acyl--CoA ligase [Alphaproteobacteria bacterium]
MASRNEIVALLTREGPFELVEDTSLGYPMKVYRNAPPNMRAILEATRQFDERAFLVYNDEEITFRAHFHRAAALARWLFERGVRKGDRVAIGMRNYPEWVVSFWACQAIGAVVVAINAWWTGDEIQYALSDSETSVLLIDGERLARLEPIVDLAAFRAVIVARRGAAGGPGVDFEDVLVADADLPAVDIAPDDPATILYTSGTTGKPKGAVATQRNHVTNFMNTMLAGAVGKALLGDFTALPPSEMPQNSALQTFPFFHIGGLTGLYASTGTGSKLVLMYKWNPAEALDLVMRHGISAVSGVPIVVRQLLEAATASGVNPSSILGISAGGASVPPDLIQRIEGQFEAKASAANGYGLTETTSAVIVNSGQEYFQHPDSVGRPVATAQVEIADDEGRFLGEHQIGELWVRGPNVVRGYWGNPEATEAAFGGGWFRTGDLGYRDSDGLYYVVDRKKDVIIRGGENVYCAEVEAQLLAHPLVRDAAVIGLPDPVYGERVAAVIQIDELSRAEELKGALMGTLPERLARFKVPSVYHFMNTELPRTATGKVLKRELRAVFE